MVGHTSRLTEKRWIIILIHETAPKVLAGKESAIGWPTSAAAVLVPLGRVGLSSGRCRGNAR